MTPRERDELPAELRAFLYACIDATEQVEILVLLLRSSRAWTCRQVADALVLTERAARVHLETLTACGLLTVDVGAEVSYRYAPRTPQLAAYSADLADLFTRARTKVLGFVATRCGPSRRLANAFRRRDHGE